MGLIFCTNCGASMSDDSAFCMECGASLTVNASPSVPAPINTSPVLGRICPSCGCPLDDDAVFCTGCGRAIDAPVPAAHDFSEMARENPPATPECVPEHVPKSGKICPTCGSSVDDDSRFCSACGRVFEEILHRCSFCNAIIAPDSGVCAVCGSPVGSLAESIVSETVPDSEPAAHAEPVMNGEITEKERRAAERNFHKPPKL